MGEEGGLIDTPGPAPTAARAPLVQRVLTALAVGAIGAFALLLGVRTLTTPDLGYHLAYGDHFLDRGELVDSGLFVYPTVKPTNETDVGPGCWYDEQGRYRFPNANWLSQIVMAGVHRAAGLKGLSVLLAVLVAAILAVGAVTMRRLGIGWVGVAAGTGMTVMVAYERFLLRPELFGYLALVAQFCLLARRRVGRPAAVGLVGLQWVLVNLHSYFLLGLGLTGAVLVERAVRWGWARRRGLAKPQAASPSRATARGDRTDREDRTGREDRAQVLRLAWVLGAQILVCFVNPWGWRLAALPLQTLLFVRKHGIAGGSATGEGHPWAIIGEFFRPFATDIFERSKASTAYCVLLSLAAAGAAAAVAKRRWAHLLVIAAMTAVSLSMRRNIAPAALLIVPPALSACRDLLAGARTLWNRHAPTAATVAAAILTGLGSFGAFTVVTHRFYLHDGRAVRCGLGVARTVVPVAAAQWISRHDPPGRLWTDYNSSSNAYYFTRPHRDVPILTNTWAYPPQVMRRVLNCSIGRAPFDRVVDEFGCRTVLLHMDSTSIPLARKLVADANWALVHVDALDVVFVRADGPTAELARRAALTPRTFDADAFERMLLAVDPAPSSSMYLGGFTLAHLGWDTQAVEILGRAIRRFPHSSDLHRMWNMKGTSLARRGTLRMLEQPPDLRGKQDWHEARNCFLEALRAEPDYAPAARNLAEVDKQIAAEKRGILYKYPW